ncbi:YfhO family protein [Luteococcus sp. Sow4_B9]|uniref:YfhO family protein n=1 Tax=Luteococcus sp. Sow4_B9 TaxID=3438792 RepID=UPI003F99C536
MPTALRHHRILSASTAAVLTLAVHLLVMRRRQIVPFGETTRGVGDYGPQYVPFHHALSQILHGSEQIGLDFNWLSGGGVAFLPDYTTYLASPFALMVGLFPPSQTELALTVTILIRLSVAAGAMSLLLTKLTPWVTPWATLPFAVTYATSAWVFDIAIYTPQWLDGLISFPLLCLAALWCREDRRRLLAILVVAEAWWSNYYTAYMASLGAALFLVLWLATTGVSWLEGLRSVLRFALTGLVGVLLVAPLLVPTALAVANGVPYGRSSLGEVTPRSALVRLLPFTEGVMRTPALAVGTLGLLLALAQPFCSRRPLRQRLVWTGGLAALFGSLLWLPTVMAWNVFDIPNGNPFRFSFVLTGFLVLTAWFCVQDGRLGSVTVLRWPSMLACLAGVGQLMLLTRLANQVQEKQLLIHPSAISAWSLRIGAGVLLVSLVQLRWRKIAALAAAALALLSFVETERSAYFIDTALRIDLGTAPAHDPTARNYQTLASRATSQATWPQGRVSAEAWPREYSWMSYNNPLLRGYPSLPYYSSTLPLAVSETLQGLGVASRANGRMLIDTRDPGLDPLLAVSVRGSDHLLTQTDRLEAFAMVRAVGAAPASAAGLPRPARLRNDLLDEPVYHPAEGIHFSKEPRQNGRLTVGVGETVVATASCAPGQVLQLFIDGGNGLVEWSDASGGKHRMGSFDRRVLTLAPAPRGAIRLSGRSPAGISMTPGGLACLDSSSLAQQVSSMETPLIDVDGASIHAQFAQPIRGSIIVATTAQRGWTCSLDGREVPVEPRSGLLGVHADGRSELSCSYHTPGLRTGLALGALAAILAMAYWWAGRRRDRVRAAATRAEGD